MKFTKEMKKNVNKWLAENDFFVTCKIGKEFLYEPNDYYIQVQKKYDNSFDSDFIVTLRKLGLKHDFDCITLSILHELGHSETQDFFTEEEWELDNVLKMVLSEHITDQHKLNVKYWETETEKSANEWLVDFVNKYPNKVQDLENIVEMAFTYKQ